MNSTAHSSFSPTAARIYGAATVLAPLLMLASTIAYITVGDGINEGLLGGVIGVWAAFVLAVALVGILRLMEPRAPRAAPILTVLALISVAAGVGIQIDYLLQHEMGPELSAAVDEALVGSDLVAVAILPGLLLPPTLVAIGVFLLRTRTTPWWTGALLIAGGVMFIVAMPEGIAPLAVLTELLLAAALIPIGVALFGASQREGELVG